MCAIDEDHLAGIEGGLEEYVTTVEVSRERPYFDIEVLSDPHVDAPAGDGDGRAPLTHGELTSAFLERYEKLRRPFSESRPHVVVSRGQPIVQPSPGAATIDSQKGAHAQVWASVLAELAEKAGAVLCAHAAEPAPEAEELAAVFRVRLRGEEQGDQPLIEPFAYVAVLAWSGRAARGEATARGSERLIRALTESIALNTPLHAICVPALDDHQDRFFRECERLRVPLVLSGADRRTDLVTLSRAGLRPRQGPSSVAVVRCPSFKRGIATSGMARVRLNVWKGEAEIAFQHDLGSDRASQPVQVVSPTLSASRVSSSERRLYSRVGQLLDDELARSAGNPARVEAIRKFDSDASLAWSRSGYVTLCSDEGDVPLRVTRHRRYHLLLLVRERDGRYDILLSNHFPLRPSLLADWSTLLLPAFKDVRALLEHLRGDVLRQVQERTEDFERAAHAEAFERAVERILADDDGHGDNLWAEEIREVASRKINKISPTTGAVTEFDYSLVTLLPLVDRNTARAIDDGADPTLEGERRRDRHRIIEWLNGLDTVVRPEGGASAARGLSIDALELGGCGLRWEPRAGLIEEPGMKDRRRAQRAAPGAIWYPLSAAGKPPLWRQCPSIMSRNADVMSWIEEELAKRRLPDDERLPDELLLGRQRRV